MSRYNFVGYLWRRSACVHHLYIGLLLTACEFIIQLSHLNTLLMMFLSFALLLAPLGLVSALSHGNTDTLASSPLNWAPCDLSFPEDVQKNIAVPIDCATLEVPLDYTDSASSKTIMLQLVKVNATEEPVKGSVIFNPGGPGSSGVEEVVQKGPAYRE